MCIVSVSPGSVKQSKEICKAVSRSVRMRLPSREWQGETLCVCRELVTKTYNKANGYETDCEVIYGDTDSVMVHFKVPGVARAMELGREAAEFVSKTFIKPIKLEFEKVSCVFLW